MKEILKPTLTGLPKTPYYRGGDKIMPTEGQSNMPPTNSQPANPEHSEAPRGQRQPVSSERQEEARRLLKQPNLNTEVRGALERFLREGGKPFSGSAEDIPDLSRQEARIWLETLVSSGLPISPASINERIWRENGISVDDLRTKSPEELINLLRERVNPREPAAGAGGAGQGGGSEPPAPPNGPSEENSSGPNSERSQEGRPNERTIRDVFGVNAGDINDPNFKAQVNRVNNFIEDIVNKRVGGDDIQELYNRIRGQVPPENYTDEQKLIFGIDKNRILESISKAFNVQEATNSKEGKATEQIVNGVMEGDLDQIDQAIESLNINENREFDGTIRKAVERAIVTGKDDIAEYVLEYAMERILNQADENQQDQYPQFNLYQQTNLDSVLLLARTYDESRNGNKMFKYLSSLKARRYVMHELFRGMKDRKTYVSLVTQYLRKSGLAFVEREIVGVSDVQQVYEQVLGSRLSFVEDIITGEDFAAADIEVEGILKTTSNNPHLLKKTLTDAHGEIIKNEDGTNKTRPLRKWEARRAAVVGKSLSAASQRRLIYGILGDLPTNADRLLRSFDTEFISRILAPIKTLPARFFGQPMAKRYLEMWLENVRKDVKTGEYTKYGYIDKGEPNEARRAKGLYGKSQNALAMLDTGVTDPKSNSWRARLMFLKQKDYATVIIDNEEGLPIGFYLDDAKKKAEKKVKEEIEDRDPSLSEEEIKKMLESSRAFYGKGKTYKERIGELFNESIGDVIKDQRLFLGVLMRYPDLDKAVNDQNRRVIWENVARFLPSRIAAFFPYETLRIVKNSYGIADGDREAAITKWTEIRNKLWVAERARIKNDSEALRVGGSGTTGVKEIKDFFGELRNEKGEIVFEGLSEQEIKVIDSIRQMGVDHAGDLAKMTFPFTPFLEDVPVTDWGNLEDEDFDRILVNDQSAFEEGHSALIELIANPGVKPDDAIKAFVAYFHKIASPMGNKDAQGKTESHVTTYIKMTSINNFGKWLGALSKILRKPRSEAEKFNLQANIAHEPDQKRHILKGLAQNEVISDDPTEVDQNGRTQYQRIEKETDADTEANIMMYARIVLLLLGPIAGAEFLKLILPPETIKSMGL